MILPFYGVKVFFLHVVGDGPSSKVQLDATGWQDGCPIVVFVVVDRHAGKTQLCHDDMKALSMLHGCHKLFFHRAGGSDRLCLTMIGHGTTTEHKNILVASRN